MLISLFFYPRLARGIWIDGRSVPRISDQTRRKIYSISFFSLFLSFLALGGTWSKLKIMPRVNFLFVTLPEMPPLGTLSLYYCKFENADFGDPTAN